MGMEFYNEKWATATKQHNCECCGKEIKIGERYHKESGKYDGEFFSRALCSNCAEIEADYCANIDNEFLWDEIIDYARDTFCVNCQHKEKDEDGDCDYLLGECPYIKEHYSKIFAELRGGK